MSIPYSECVFAAFVIRHAMRMRHIAICGLSGCKIFFHTVSKTVRFSGEKLLKIKFVMGISQQLLSETFLILRRTE
jgi:hypothetical protein